ncbi:hypothetical protein TVAG_409360 [Trichomonas vaginalis G3]|uniref:Uncharacterized protein n=1 Tax=Trichomonas vaginalis (strain ATCC PRA-98 / G3) TaxID=412133 RepID=A2G116_TRIV3|nr:hypothetical protein TVAGG3_0230760 [Trichomonas vaginalis G3]EAX89153.1 hypothetical protein TVAG_409360 [Trichomonas vaginalis G3]KAI5552610.1 hypothetical protein TVAGG3_0230760 [Trichomonas vaginalis G3]|eukprot:XP_001302083.1 hypothetical protein [Trichomonas vaginalis G3]
MSNEKIEPSTMNYVFDMFGKSVSQMLQSSVTQQTMIDELRAQIRSLQTQVTNVCNSFQDFEDRLYIKVQEMRPTIYTRDGIPIDDALEMMQNKINQCTDKVQQQNETLDRFDIDLKQKIDQDAFESQFRDAKNAIDSYSEITQTIQTLQKDFQKQRDDMDSLTEHAMQMVQLKIEQFSNNKTPLGEADVLDANDEYAKKSYVDQQIKLVASNPFGLPDMSSFTPSGDNIQDQFTLLQMQQEQLEKAYQAQKAKLGQNYDQLYSKLDEEEDEDFEDDSKEEIFVDDFDLGDDFIFEDSEPEKEIEFRSISIDNDGNIDDESTYTDKKHSTGSRRNVGVQAQIQAKKTARSHLREQIKAKKAQTEAPSAATTKEVSGGGATLSSADEQKIQNSIVNSIMTKVENMLIDFFSMQSGLKLEKNDAKVLINQLSVVQKLKDEYKKLKLLLQGKMDSLKCNQELEIRVTRQDFFSYLTQIFPNNQLLQKVMQSSVKTTLPTLKKESPRSRPKTSIDDKDEIRVRAKTAKTQSSTQQQNLVPARNSRLLALNQKFLRGADGRYYLRDLGGEQSGITTPNITGQTKTGMNPENAMDFQPFVPDTHVKTDTNERAMTAMSSKHRSKTPTDSTE